MSQNSLIKRKLIDAESVVCSHRIAVTCISQLTAERRSSVVSRSFDSLTWRDALVWPINNPDSPEALHTNKTTTLNTVCCTLSYF